MIVEAQTYNFNTKADELLTIFLDSGSQHSFIRKDTAKSLGLILRHPQEITAITFGGHQHTETSYEVKIRLQNPVTGTPVKLKLWTRSYITSVPEEEVKTTPRKPSTGDTADVDILIGMDYYWSVIDLNHNQKLPSGLVKSHTKLGPILSGPNAPFPQINSTVVEQKESKSDTDSMVRRLLALDSADADEDRDTTDSEIIQQYNDTVQMIKGIIHVKFPWKASHPHLPDNKALAMRRLESQYRKLHVNPKMWSEYCNTSVTARDPFANTDSQEYLVSQYSLLRDSLKTFWDLWHTEYLRVLAERNQLRSANKQSTGRSPQVGDIVLIQTDNTADGAVRSVAVKLGNHKILNRSVNQLIPLEVAAEDKNSIKKPTPRTPTRIQPPRKAKKQFIR
ncbi:unnamed protein product [Heligmosomoides polygyrus]|uniref:DUF1758 domain-containing protein n=1 Tax=Heligmosomoides polygyrus TaxID=6339 RepID=A0A183FSW0_HELPZ|nr:unnamed protein product [Heligmosomoides polygyrus]